MSAIRLTYGHLPTLQFFRLRYESALMAAHPGLSPGQARRVPYPIRHGSPDRSGGVRPAAGSYDLMGLWEQLKRLTAIMDGSQPGFLPQQREEAGEYARKILLDLGLEWVKPIAAEVRP